jgi:hypothetical protein
VTSVGSLASLGLLCPKLRRNSSADIIFNGLLADNLIGSSFNFVESKDLSATCLAWGSFPGQQSHSLPLSVDPK